MITDADLAVLARARECVKVAIDQRGDVDRENKILRETLAVAVKNNNTLRTTIALMEEKEKLLEEQNALLRWLLGEEPLPWVNAKHAAGLSGK